MEKLIVSVSGVRGKVGINLDENVAYDFGCAYGTILGSGSKVVLGRDSRPTGEMIADAISRGLADCGVDVIRLGIVTTPGAALMTRNLGADGGVVVTASHNPLPYNGMKFLQPTGVAIPASTGKMIKKIWRTKTYDLVEQKNCGQITFNNSTHDQHIDAVCKTADLELIKTKKFKVVLDSVNGAGCTVTPILLEKLGCEVIHINSEPTGEFAHTPEPLEENLAELCNAVRQHNADIGFAQDPDADRLVVIDQTGRYIGEEFTIALAASFVFSRQRGKIAVNLSTSKMIDDIAKHYNAKVFRSPTGEANVVSLMNINSCIIGGEGNGGVINPKVISVRDSLVGIAMMLEYIAQTGKKLSELADDIPSYHLMKTKFPCPAYAANKIIKKAEQLYQGEPFARFNKADGLRVDLENSWFSVRASNTEPIMRIFAEAPTEGQAQELIDKIKSLAGEVISMS